MAKVNICNVDVMDNPCQFSDKFRFEITFECYENLPDDLEWKIIYVGSADSDEKDQVLDTVLVGPVPEGRHMFVFEADPPNPSLLPPAEIVGVTVILVKCAYRSQEFITIGYFLTNDYTDEELRENPPTEPDLEKLRRYVVADKPRITRRRIKWDDSQPDPAEEGPPEEEQVESTMETEAEGEKENNSTGSMTTTTGGALNTDPPMKADAGDAEIPVGKSSEMPLEDNNLPNGQNYGIAG